MRLTGYLSAVVHPLLRALCEADATPGDAFVSRHATLQHPIASFFHSCCAGLWALTHARTNLFAGCPPHPLPHFLPTRGVFHRKLGAKLLCDHIVQLDSDQNSETPKRKPTAAPHIPRAQPAELREEIIAALSVLLPTVGPEVAFFAPLVRKTLEASNVHTRHFKRVMSLLETTTTGAAYEEGASTHEGLSARGTPEPPQDATPESFTVNEIHLRRAWVSSDRSTKDDWIEWLRNFAVELLKESPSPALRACHHLAQAQPTLARELFAAAFVSCWMQLSPTTQEQLVRSLEAALASPSIPPEIVTALLNLAEFMEHDEKALPLDYRTLGVLAEKCQAFAKALHYKELEFEAAPASVVEVLISINNHLHQPEAAIGETNAPFHMHWDAGPLSTKLGRSVQSSLPCSTSSLPPPLHDGPPPVSSRRHARVCAP